jgi:hypothetical protein
MTHSSSGPAWARPIAAFVAAGVYGAVLWGTAPIWAGAKEPWDGAFGLYMFALTAGGLFAMIAPRRALAAPAGMVVGQVAWQIATGAGSLWPLAMIMLSVLAVPAAGVAGVIWLIDWRSRSRGEPGACAACGYDRKGIGDRECPECGAAAAAPSVGAAWPTRQQSPLPPSSS